MKKIMILGAGIYQVPLIKTAKRMGLYVIVVSIPGPYPGFALADQVCYINTTDKEAVLEVARKEQISAIVTTGTDVAVSTIGYVCEQMGLPGLGYEASLSATDKARMKEAFRQGGVRTAAFEVVSSCDEALEALVKLGVPAMLKIVDKSGSRGIVKIHSAEQLRQVYPSVREETQKPYMILESFVEGNEIGIDAFVQNGQIQWIVPHDKLVFQSGKTGIPLGHICPITVERPEVMAEFEEQTRLAIRALGLDNCAVNMDAFVTAEGKVYVIEAAGRCGATGIPEVMSGFLGIDYYEAILKNALGQAVDQPQTEGKPSASMLLYSRESGLLRHIKYTVAGHSYSNEDCNMGAEGIVSLDYLPGESIHAFENGTHRIGQAVFTADTVEEIWDRIHGFEASMEVVVEKI